MGDKGNGFTAKGVLSESGAKGGLLLSLVDMMELSERDSFASLDFILGAAVASSHRECVLATLHSHPRHCHQVRT